jgi:NAD(P)-dependent dehydrogenase (short-subunit alcohol dehydrogenase family)
MSRTKLQPQRSVGAGDFIGAAIARKFAAEGFTTVVGGATATSSRRSSPTSRRPAARRFGRSLDARKEDDLTAFLQEAEREAPLEVCIFNIGANVNFPILGDDRARLPQGLGDGLLLGLHRRPRGRAPDAAALQGAIFFTGATASLRGGVGYAAFAAPRPGCAWWRSRWRASSGRRTSMSAHLVIDAGVRHRVRPREESAAAKATQRSRTCRRTG